MNYYKHYMGDYMRDTGVLTLAQDGAYRRMMDHYYSTEHPLPCKASELYRMCGAMTKTEREAVDFVAAKFFYEKNGFLHKDRIDEEIAIAQAKIANLKANGATGGKKSGQVRASKKEANASEDCEANASPKAQANTNNTNNQYPLKQEESSSSVKHHVDDDNSERPGLPPLQAVELDHTPALAMTVELRKVGVNVTSIHPMLIEWIAKGIQLKTLMEAVTLAREYKPAPERIPPAYLNTILAQMLNQKPSKGAPLPEAKQWWETATGIEDKGITLGVLKNASEGFPDYKLRVFQAAGDGPWIEKSRGSSSTQGFTKASSSLTTQH